MKKKNKKPTLKQRLKKLTRNFKKKGRKHPQKGQSTEATNAASVANTAAVASEAASGPSEEQGSEIPHRVQVTEKKVTLNLSEIPHRVQVTEKKVTLNLDDYMWRPRSLKAEIPSRIELKVSERFKSSISKKEAALEAAQRKVDDLSERCSRLQTRCSSSSGYLHSMEREISRLERQLAAETEDPSASQQLPSVAKLEEKIAQLRTEFTLTSTRLQDDRAILKGVQSEEEGEASDQGFEEQLHQAQRDLRAIRREKTAMQRYETRLQRGYARHFTNVKPSKVRLALVFEGTGKIFLQLTPMDSQAKAFLENLLLREALLSQPAIPSGLNTYVTPFFKRSSLRNLKGLNAAIDKYTELETTSEKDKADAKKYKRYHNFKTCLQQPPLKPSRAQRKELDTGITFVRSGNFYLIEAKSNARNDSSRWKVTNSKWRDTYNLRHIINTFFPDYNAERLERLLRDRRLDAVQLHTQPLPTVVILPARGTTVTETQIEEAQCREERETVGEMRPIDETPLPRLAALGDDDGDNVVPPPTAAPLSQPINEGPAAQATAPAAIPSQQHLRQSPQLEIFVHLRECLREQLDRSRNQAKRLEEASFGRVTSILPRTNRRTVSNTIGKPFPLLHNFFKNLPRDTIKQICAGPCTIGDAQYKVRALIVKHLIEAPCFVNYLDQLFDDQRGCLKIGDATKPRALRTIALREDETALIRNLISINKVRNERVVQLLALTSQQPSWFDFLDNGLKIVQSLETQLVALGKMARATAERLPHVCLEKPANIVGDNEEEEEGEVAEKPRDPRRQLSVRRRTNAAEAGIFAQQQTSRNTTQQAMPPTSEQDSKDANSSIKHSS